MCNVIVGGTEVPAVRLGKRADGTTREAGPDEVIGENQQGDRFLLKAKDLPGKFAKRAMVYVQTGNQ